MADANDKRFESVDLSAIISSELASAKAFGRSEIDGKRALALEYAQGRMPDIQRLPNRSKMVSRDVSDTNAWILPGLVRVFTSSSAMVEYEATRPGSDVWAKDATEFTNYDFMRNNNGYQIVYNACWDAIHLDMGVVSSEWVPVVKKRETIKRQTLEQLAMMQDEGIEILTAKPLEEMYETEAEGVDEFGMPAIVIQMQPYYDVKINRVVKEGHIRDETLRPENLMLNDAATSIEEARFCGYRYDNKTRSDLMQMADDLGFDKDVIRELPTDDVGEDEVELSRRPLVAVDYDSPVRSGDIIDLYRCFTLVDVDGDDIAEMVEAWYAGSKVLAWQVWEDDNPYTDIPCYPVPHRFNGESVADRTMDVQRAKTVLLRQTMDNLYASAVPMQEVEVGSVLNPDALVQKKFGTIIWKKTGSSPIVWQQVPFYADKSLAAMGYFDDVIAKRTGVSRTTMALDPEALQNQTATASQQARDAGYSQIEMIARNMAEMGWSRFFAKRLKLAVKYQQIATVPAPETDEKFRQVEPQQWDDDMSVTVNVGLGTGSKDRDMAMLNTIQQSQMLQAQLLGQVPGAQAKALEYIPLINKTNIKMAESSGLKNPETYFPVIDEADIEAFKKAAAEPKTNPAVELEQMKAQAAAQTEQVKGQVQIQTKQIDAQLSMQQAELKAQGDVVKNQAELDADLATKQADRQNAIALEAMKQQFEREKLDRDDAFRYAKLAQDRDLELLKIGVAQQASAANAEMAEGGQE